MRPKPPRPPPSRPALPGRPETAAPLRRQGPSWVDERQSERGDQRVLQGFAALRAERVYEEAATCAGCAEARQRDARDDALCDAHLEQALGLGGGGGWGL